MHGTEEALVPIRFIQYFSLFQLISGILRVIVARGQLRVPGRGCVLGYVVAREGGGPREMLMTCCWNREHKIISGRRRSCGMGKWTIIEHSYRSLINPLSLCRTKPLPASLLLTTRPLHPSPFPAPPTGWWQSDKNHSPGLMQVRERLCSGG
jgi:hypothetical protein